MAITLRLDENQEKYLSKFMDSSYHSTKSKAVLWLIENAERLVESDKKLNAITDAHERKTSAENLLSDLLTR